MNRSRDDDTGRQLNRRDSPETLVVSNVPRAMERRVPAREYWRFTAEDGASDQCVLFTDAFGRILQLSLAVGAVIVLYIKRKLEHPARPLKVRVPTPRGDKLVFGS